MEKALSPDLEQSSAVVNHLDEIGQIDHSDLQWSTDIDLSHLDNHLKKRATKFLNDYSGIFASFVLDLPGCDSVMHTLKLAADTPVLVSQYRIPYNLRDEMDKKLNLLLEAEILMPSNSQYSAPVLLIKKS